MNKTTRNIIIGVVALVVLVVAGVGIYSKFGPQASEGTKAYTLTVVDDNGEETVYEGKTDAEYLSGLMDELVEEGDFSYEGTSDDYGLYINTVNGLTADYNTDGAYWSIYVNDEYGQYGADSQPVADGDSFKLAYEVYSAQ